MSEKIIDNICILKAFSKRSQKIRIEYDSDASFPEKQCAMTLLAARP